ncbi:hypothetical protein [Streptomyces microflavus]|uniref:hypothetical protein n=1 Tax=Streptomyces microflavus TaxID=1919 RepID=UPI00382D3E8D
MTLPRSFWCHVDYVGPAVDNLTPQSVLTPFPGRAITWLREAARDIAPGLDRESFASVWAWLGDHQGAGRAVHELRCGLPYDFRIQAENCCWVWSVHIVTVLPVVDSCLVAPHRPRELVPGVAIRPPP